MVETTQVACTYLHARASKHGTFELGLTLVKVRRNNVLRMTGGNP